MIDWARRHQITAFLILAFAVPWFGWTAREVLPLETWFGDGEVLHRVRWTLFYFGAGASIAGLIMSFVVGGWAGVKTLFIRRFRWRAHWGWWLFIFIAPILFAVGRVDNFVRHYFSKIAFHSLRRKCKTMTGLKL